MINITKDEVWFNPKEKTPFGFVIGSNNIFCKIFKFAIEFKNIPKITI